MEYITLFTIGALGSLGHCVGMCGGFVSAYSLRLQQQRGLAAAFLPHLLYNGGRLTTYVLLGLLFGLAGETLRIAGGFARLQASIQLLAGLLMIAIALHAAGWLQKPLSFLSRHSSGLLRIMQRVPRKSSHRGLLLMGGLMGLMPCGLVYAVGAQAATANSLGAAMLMMLAFGLGTLPTLVALGMGANRLSVRLRGQLFRLAAVLVVALGLFSLYRGGSSLLSAPADSTMQPAIHCLPSGGLSDAAN